MLASAIILTFRLTRVLKVSVRTLSQWLVRLSSLFSGCFITTSTHALHSYVYASQALRTYVSSYKIYKFTFLTMSIKICKHVNINKNKVSGDLSSSFYLDATLYKHRNDVPNRSRVINNTQWYLYRGVWRRINYSYVMVYDCRRA